MAVVNQPWFFLFFFIHLCSCSQNIETFYPFSPPPSSPSPPPAYSVSPPPNGTLSFPPLQPPTPAATPKPGSDKTLVKAVAATAASTFVVATLLFFFVRRYMIRRRRKEGRVDDSLRGSPVVLNDNFERSNGGFKGLVVDEDGLDVHYWRKLEEEIVKNSSLGHKKSFHKVFQSPEDDEEEKVVHRRVQEVPLLLGKSSNSQNAVVAGTSKPHINRASSARTHSVGELSLTSLPSNSSIESIPAPPAPPLPLQNSQSLMALPKKQAPPPPPQNSVAIPEKANPAAPPPPPLPLLVKNSSAPPPPPPPKFGGSARSSKLPPVKEQMPVGNENGDAADGDEAAGTGNAQVKLKPLHWDKVNKNTEHSMVWDKIGGGSFRVDDDLMEALFGTVATNRKSPRGRSNLGVSDDSNQGQASQIVILDSRKSQNMAIVLKSLGISHRALVDALIDGEDLNADSLEKLMRIAPTKEEQAQILEFNGDPTRLADAESFLYHLLKAVPSAFIRLDAMLFRSSYDAEILQFKDLLQTLELGCKELRNRGLFTKLLEAILKAGNRMNAGTARGNAQAFRLTSLRKLSDVKSTDGKTTLLHFVVEEVVRAEGKRCVLNRNRSLSRSSNGNSTVSENSAPKEEREKEYKKLGLPIVGGLSSEFSNVKKAAQIDYESFVRTCLDVMARATEVRRNLSQCGSSKESNFVRVMKDFLESVEQELAVLKREQMRIMETVKRTAEYYQPGAFNDKETNPLQLFVIIKEFLGMVDQVCVEIARNLQRRKPSTSSVGLSTKSPATRIPARFPNLPERFMKDKSRSNSSESGGDY